MSIVELRQVTKRYDRDPVIRGVDLTIGDGELMVLVGPSGCGKTSVLRMVAGLEPITSGDVFVDGHNIRGMEVRDRDLAMVFQNSLLYPHMNVAENLAFPLKMAGVRRGEVKRRVADVAQMIGVHDLLPRRPNQLSGGQRQRVAMGRALIRQPQLLLMDEPMSNLDAKLRTELRSAVGHLQHRLGVTTLYVTHDQIEAMALGHRIAVMRDGLIVQCGTPSEVYHRPVDAFVGSFIGSPPMNLMLGHVAVGAHDAAVMVGASSLPLAPEHTKALRGLDGRAVAVGIRAQALRFTNGSGLDIDVDTVDQSSGRCTVRATARTPAVEVTLDGVSTRERAAEVVLDLDSDDELDLELWRRSTLAVDPIDIHLFDMADGRSLLRADASDHARAAG